MFNKLKASIFSSCTLPQNSIYDLEWDVYLNYFRIISAVNRNDHFVTQVSLEVVISLKYTQKIHFRSTYQYQNIDGEWVMITGITVPQDSGATQDDAGKVTLSKKIRDYTLTFPTTSLTRRVRLTVFQADLNTRTNFVLTEVIVSGGCRRFINF